MDEIEVKIQKLQNKLQASELKYAELLEKDKHNADRSPVIVYHEL